MKERSRRKKERNSQENSMSLSSLRVNAKQDHFNLFVVIFIFILVSAKTGYNVNESMEELVDLILEFNGY